MITVRLMGGLGNQMFQAAYARALVARGYDVQLDKSGLADGAGHVHREYSLGIFNIKAVDTETGSRITEQGMPFNPMYLHPPTTATMIGYWQTEKYFKEIENQIRMRFGWPLWPPGEARDVSPNFYQVHNDIRDNGGIAIHVRRQDYVNLQAYHGMPTMEYYRNAYAYIRNRTFGEKAFVFSDDREWCYENFPKDFTIVDGMNKYEDMYLMSSCRHAIIANSSFSWWGAWLGDHQPDGRIVIAPKQWFTERSIDSSDIVPERWVKL